MRINAVALSFQSHLQLCFSLFRRSQLCFQVLALNDCGVSFRTVGDQLLGRFIHRAPKCTCSGATLLKLRTRRSI